MKNSSALPFIPTWGDIVVVLNEEDTAKTVENFVSLANGTKFLEEGQPESEAEPFYD